LELKVPVSNETPFRVGSLTKQFTAAVLLQLADEGKLSIDDKLAKYYPDFPRGKDITLAQILHHTSGIHSFTEAPEYEKSLSLMHHTTDDMIDFIAKQPKTQDFEPGAGWAYSNSGYFILGGIVEKVTGQPLAKTLKDRLFTPLGLSHTALDDEEEIVPGRASGYSASGRGQFTNAGFVSMTVPGGAGAMRSTAEDLVKWNAALYGGKVVKPATLNAMMTPGKLNNGQLSSTAMPKRDNDRRTREYGYALSISDLEGHAQIGHAGGINGFNSQLAEFPKDHVTVVVLSNTIGKDVGADGVAERIERVALGLPPKK
jgi:CubicO group peptidase (beta-lactamase class C family)